MTVGLVVAGGYSTRFGIVEKPLVEVAGEPMLARAVRALSAVTDEVVIDCRTDQVEPFRSALEGVVVEPAFAIDEEPDCGPIAGLANGLASIDDGEVAVSSCDRPGLTPAVLDRLRSRRRTDGADAAVPEIDGRLQPLCGVYRTAPLRDAVDEAVATGERRLCSIPRELTGCVLPERALWDVVDPGAIASVDTPVEAQLWSPPAEQAAGREDRSALAGPSGSIAGD